ncbi:MAG: hypothetical protein ABRQ38_01375 [Candidatus Eremiobacterota bacterium]
MNIRKNDHVPFSSVEESKTYQRAMNFKKDMEDIAQTAIKFDDKVTIDFNSNVTGDVLIENQLLQKESSKKFSGRIIYEPEDHQLLQGELKSQGFIHTSRSKNTTSIETTYNYSQEGNHQVYEMSEKCSWNDPNSGEPMSAGGQHKKLTIDKQTGNMEFSE